MFIPNTTRQIGHATQTANRRRSQGRKKYNSLLSSVSAATWLLNPKDYEKRIQCLKPYFFSEV